jgi:antitoxin VapB
MHLNIKSDEAHALAVELARLTNQSISKAVTRAIRLQLEREKRIRSRDALAEELLDIGRRCAQHKRHDTRPHGEVLYDDRGVPKS